MRGDLPFCSSPLIALSVAYKLSSCCKIVSETQNRKSLVGILKVNTFRLFLSCGLKLVIEAHPKGRLSQRGKWDKFKEKANLSSERTNMKKNAGFCWELVSHLRMALKLAQSAWISAHGLLKTQCVLLCIQRCVFFLRVWHLTGRKDHDSPPVSFHWVF